MAHLPAIARPIAVLDAGRTMFEQANNWVQSFLAYQKVYRSTYRELSALTDRDLSDIGIPRSNIKTLAKEAANGK